MNANCCHKIKLKTDKNALHSKGWELLLVIKLVCRQGPSLIFLPKQFPTQTVYWCCRGTWLTFREALCGGKGGMKSASCDDDSCMLLLVVG